VEQAVAETVTALQETRAFLEVVKRKGGVCRGDIWWMERELVEQEKFLPQSKQKKAAPRSEVAIS
jgi:hypothetical protein